MRKKKRKNWLVELYEDNKLYIWVVVGVLVISGVTIGITVGSSNNAQVVPNGDISYINENEDNIGIAETNTTPVKENKEDENNNVTESKLTNDTKKENTSKTQSNQQETVDEIKENKQEEIKKLEFIMPLDGQVSKDFSEDTLIYSNTLEEWINHTGIDIKADKAIPVKAIENGTVIGVKQDPRYGYTIIIDHGQGYKSIYCNLSTLDMVFEGKTVEKGQVISGVGDTALFEIKDDVHLHLEIMFNEEYINPLDIIK